MNAQERFNLTGQVALVTGAARGIGQAIAVALAQHGADIIIIDIASEEAMADTQNQITALGRKCWSITHDLSQTETLPDLIDRAWALAGKINILVNNAAIAFLDHFNEITPERWRRVMAINLDAPFFLAQRAAERMIQERIKGRIINISSINGQVAEAGLAHYNASKGGIELMTRSLATELGGYGITVNALAPGSTATQIGSEFKIDPKFFDYICEHIPLETRMARVDEVASAAVFLASPGASYITGSTLLVDGGLAAQQKPRLQFMTPLRLNTPPGA